MQSAITLNKYGTQLTFWRYEGFAAWRAPSHRVHLRDAEVTPEVFTAVIVKAFIPQESLEPCTAQNTTQNSSLSKSPFKIHLLAYSLLSSPYHMVFIIGWGPSLTCTGHVNQHLKPGILRLKALLKHLLFHGNWANPICWWRLWYGWKVQNKQQDLKSSCITTVIQFSSLNNETIRKKIADGSNYRIESGLLTVLSECVIYIKPRSSLMFPFYFGQMLITIAAHVCFYLIADEISSLSCREITFLLCLTLTGEREREKLHQRHPACHLLIFHVFGIFLRYSKDYETSMKCW